MSDSDRESSSVVRFIIGFLMGCGSGYYLSAIKTHSLPPGGIAAATLAIGVLLGIGAIMIDSGIGKGLFDVFFDWW